MSSASATELLKLLVMGGARSGKSRHALEVARELGQSRAYVATAEPLDDEMRERIQRHRDERDPGWVNLEEPVEIVPLLTSADVVIVDCLTLWLSNLLMRERTDGQIMGEFGRLATAIIDAPNNIVLVTNEVGLGIVPQTPLGRRFRDLSGALSQEVARSCSRVVMMCAGIALQVK